MRIFVAIPIDLKVKDYLDEIKNNIKKSAQGINWVAKRNLHITLKFLGEIKESQIEDIKENLSKIKKKSFSLKLEDFGIFPSEFDPRVIWVGISPASKVIDMQKEVDESLIGFGKQETKFEAHITLGRVKRIKDKKEFLKLINSIKVKELSFVVNEFILYKSNLTKDSPRYEILEAYPLE